jgi:ABC-type spermidine/putrescine transport system permease subunit II
MIGVLVGRHVQSARGIWMLIAYLPFACSPVIIGICLLDLFIRLGLASTLLGVFLIQSVFASAFAVILFSELWSPEIARLEHLVQTLGGSSWSTWRHAIWPRLWKLTAVCWLQTLLFSWLDYSLVSTIGGGVVPALTLGVIAYMREASINQAAQAAIVLIIPPMLFMMLIAQLLRRRIPVGNANG